MQTTPESLPGPVGHSVPMNAAGGPPGGYGPPGAPGGYGPPPSGGAPPGGYGGPPGGGFGGPPGGIGGMGPGGPVGAQPPGAPMAPMGAPPAKKGGKGVIIGAAIGAVVLVGGGVAAWMLLGKSSAIFPCDIAKLPSDTEMVLRASAGKAERFGIAEKDVPEQAKWSKYARQLCGGQDVFNTALGLSSHSGDTVARIDPKDAEKYLACGKAFAEKEKSSAIYNITIGKESVNVVLNGLEEHPGSVKSMKDGKDIDKLVSVKCVPDESGLRSRGEDGEKKEEDKDAKCTGTHIARVKDTNMWVSGSRKAVEAFADGFSPDGDKGLKGKDKDGMDAMSGKVSSFPTAIVGKGEATVASHVFSASTEDDSKDRTEIMKDLKDFEVFYASGEQQEPSGTKEVLYLKAKDDKAATDIVSKLEKLYKLHKAGS